LNGFENGSAENRIEYILLTTEMEIPSFSQRTGLGSQKLPLLNGFTAWNYLKNKEKVDSGINLIWFLLILLSLY